MHDTFERVFRLLNAKAYQACFLACVQAVNRITGGRVIAIDGKELRSSMDEPLRIRAIYMVSPWASEDRLALAQEKGDERSNEKMAKVGRFLRTGRGFPVAGPVFHKV